MARLGWYLYTSGQLQVAGLPVEYDYTRTPAGDVFSERRKGYDFEVVEPSTMTFAGLYNPSPGRNERPYFPYGLSGLSDEEKEMVMTLNPSTTPSAEIVPMMERLGIAPSETARAAYFSEPMFIPDYARTNPKEFMGDRATVMITLAHELRHAAMNYLSYEHGAPRLSIGQEESMMDFIDDRSRRIAASKSRNVADESPYIAVAERATDAQRGYIRDRVNTFENLATQVLKDKNVPPVSKPQEKGSMDKGIDFVSNLVNDFITNRKSSAPVDYKSEAMQSPRF